MLAQDTSWIMPQQLAQGLWEEGAWNCLLPGSIRPGLFRPTAHVNQHQDKPAWPLYQKILWNRQAETPGQSSPDVIVLDPPRSTIIQEVEPTLQGLDSDHRVMLRGCRHQGI